MEGGELGFGFGLGFGLLREEGPTCPNTAVTSDGKDALVWNRMSPQIEFTIVCRKPMYQLGVYEIEDGLYNLQRYLKGNRKKF